MNIDDRIKDPLLGQLSSRPSDEGAWDELTALARRDRRNRLAVTIVASVAAILALTSGGPQLLPQSAKAPIVVTSQPPSLDGGEPAAAPAASGSASPSTSSTPDASKPIQGVQSNLPTASPASALPVLRLIQRRNMAAPVGNATGITYDGSKIWVMAGGHNADTHTLTEVDPTTGAVGRRWTFANLIEQAGTGVYGITWDGADIWISVAGNTNKLVKVDTVTGQIIATLSSPTTLGPSDLDYAEGDLWLSSGTGELYRIDPSSGSIKKQFSSWETDERDHGNALHNKEMWVGGLFGGVKVQDSATGDVVANVADAQGKAFSKRWGTMSFISEQLVLLDQYGITFYDVTR